MPQISFECRKAQEAMMDRLAADSSEGVGASDGGLLDHLNHCPDCRQLLAELTATHELLAATRDPLPVIPDQLWDRLTPQLAATPQEKHRAAPPLASSGADSPPLLLQYTYLVVLGMTVWAGLVYGQPVFTAMLTNLGWNLPHWFLIEYGLFIVFFTTGGFFAILAAPILLAATDGDQTGNAAGGFFRRLLRSLTGKLRVFSILTC
jgi:hypothetical protein